VRAVTAAALTALLVATVGCSSSNSTSSLTVVTSTTVLADFVHQVGGDRVSVTALVPKGGDVHTFDPSASEATAVSRAGLIVMNGLGLDDWLVSFAQEVGAGDTPDVQLAVDLPGVDYIDNNPHLWMDAAYAAKYVERVRQKLIEIDPDGREVYDSNAVRYQQQLTALDDWARAQLATIPADERRVVTFHDAFPYFAAAYDLEMVGVLVESPGQDPSPAAVARLIDAIRQSGVKVILAEAQFGDQLAQTISDETGVTVVNDLYTDTLGDAPVDTYDGALRWDVEQITKALE
jgi:manganese/iron transport system substrate-binding protein